MEVFKSDFVKYQTILGEDGWHYLWNMDGITDIVNGTTRHDAVQLHAETRNIELRESWCRQRNITYIHTIAPDKSSIYPEFMPEEAGYCKEGLLDQFSDALLRRDVTFIDLRRMLKDLKGEMQVYFKTDSHWTYEAAYRVYLRIMDVVADRFPGVQALAEDRIVRRERSRVMELSAITDAPIAETFVQIEPAEKKSKLVYQTNSTRGRIQVYDGSRSDFPRALIFRDSFSSFFLPLLCESFSRVVVINSRTFWYDLVEQEKPDVILVEVAERYLDPVVIDLGRKSFFETFAVEISDIVKRGRVK